MESEFRRDALRNQFDHLTNGVFRRLRPEEKHIRPVAARAEPRKFASIDPMRIHDDPALRGLSEDLGQAHDRHRSRRDDVAENLPRAYRRQLIDIADEQQCRALRQSPKDRPHERHIDH